MRFRSESQRRAVFARLALGTGAGAASGYIATRVGKKLVRKTQGLMIRATDRAMAKSGADVVTRRKAASGIAHYILPKVYKGLKSNKKVLGAMVAGGAALGAIV